MILKCVLVAFVLAAASARTTSSANLNEIPKEEARSSESPTSYLSDLRYAYKVYQECAAGDLSPCLKLKLVTAMDRAFRSYSALPIYDGVTFVKDPAAPAESAPKTETELDASLPRGLDRDDALNALITDKISNFLNTHSLQIKFPNANEIQRSLDTEEGRGKKKKMGNFLLLPLLLGGTLIPIALGALALLAGKALIISKLALVLAGIIGLKKLFGGGGHGGGHEASHEVVVAGGGHGGGGAGWARSYDKQQAQKLAYSAYAQTAR